MVSTKSVLLVLPTERYVVVETESNAFIFLMGSLQSIFTHKRKTLDHNILDWQS